jgi:hypothetical protein
MEAEKPGWGAGQYMKSNLYQLNNPSEDREQAIANLRKQDFADRVPGGRGIIDRNNDIDEYLINKNKSPKEFKETKGQYDQTHPTTNTPKLNS